ncbi:hypothetical protein SAMN05216276_102091 [Streptosporangium subroseum]|uniref:Uncharacterized protein n=1 Tax=Streptosporangium subroseum TaxID=106412 RepID=A0A239IRC8_9ACTN|nr:hypothetical protein SAMN05216276_102091 [Streptosporangium subroseum]
MTAGPAGTIFRSASSSFGTISRAALPDPGRPPDRPRRHPYREPSPFGVIRAGADPHSAHEARVRSGRMRNGADSAIRTHEARDVQAPAGCSAGRNLKVPLIASNSS